MTVSRLITSEQLRGARAMLRWSIKDLSEASGVSVATIQRMEQEDGINNTLAKNVAAVTMSLESHGIHFLDDTGVMLGKK